MPLLQCEHDHCGAAIYHSLICLDLLLGGALQFIGGCAFWLLHGLNIRWVIDDLILRDDVSSVQISGCVWCHVAQKKSCILPLCQHHPVSAIVPEAINHVNEQSYCTLRGCNYLFVTPMASCCHSWGRGVRRTPGVNLCVRACSCHYPCVSEASAELWMGREGGSLTGSITAVRWGVPTLLHVCFAEEGKEGERLHLPQAFYLYHFQGLFLCLFCQ